MNDCSARVMVISVAAGIAFSAVMIVCVCRNGRGVVIGFGGKGNSRAILPRRGDTREKDEERTCDENRAFHCQP
jgi:hypothetical protein